VGRRKCSACRSRLSRKGRGIQVGPGVETTTRKCLKCKRPFESIGVGNRICRACNFENESYRPGIPRGRIRGAHPQCNREDFVEAILGVVHG